MNTYVLKNKWTLWYHSINNKEWDNKSYVKVIEIKTLLDYKLLDNIFKINHLQNGMFFLMINDIFPTWEDPKNRLGGCISFKYDNRYLFKISFNYNSATFIPNYFNFCILLSNIYLNVKIIFFILYVFPGKKI